MTTCWHLRERYAMNNKQYLTAMGIQVWHDKSQSLSEKVSQSDSTVDEWQSLRQKALNCTACGLSKSRTHVVFGVGNTKANLLIIGEAPGVNEDKQGEPFVGRAGKLLTNMLLAIGLQRRDVYIANILKCRPPNNRDPKPEEVALCTPFLEQQINLIQPKVILAVGRIAAHFLIGSTDSLGKMRGKQYQYRDIPLLISYHPAYLLRSPREKRKAQQDLMQLKNYLP